MTHSAKRTNRGSLTSGGLNLKVEHDHQSEQSTDYRHFQISTVSVSLPGVAAAVLVCEIVPLAEDPMRIRDRDLPGANADRNRIVW